MPKSLAKEEYVSVLESRGPRFDTPDPSLLQTLRFDIAIVLVAKALPPRNAHATLSHCNVSFALASSSLALHIKRCPVLSTAPLLSSMSVGGEKNGQSQHQLSPAYPSS